MSWTRLIPAWLAVLILTVLAPTSPAADRYGLLTPEEIARVDRENALWHLVQADLDLPANLARLRANGATPADLAWFEPKLTAIWDVALHREFGWMHPDQVEAIKAVDRVFTARLRAARVRREVAIELDPSHRGESPLTVLALWRRMILRTLDYDQVAEFRLMNSDSAEKVARFLENIPLSDDERRTIYTWQREYDASDRPFAHDSDALDYRLFHWIRMRDLLGDERMVLYLMAAEPQFARLQDALGPEVSNTTALDAWRAFKEFQIEQRKGPTAGETVGDQQKRMQARLRTLLGEANWAHFVDDPKSGEWLLALGTKPVPVAVWQAPR